MTLHQRNICLEKALGKGSLFLHFLDPENGDRLTKPFLTGWF